MATQVLNEKASNALDRWRTQRLRVESLKGELAEAERQVQFFANLIGDNIAPPDAKLGEVITVPIGAEFLVIEAGSALDEERYKVKWRGEK